MSYLTNQIRERYGRAYYSQLNYRDYLSRRFESLAKDLIAAMDVKRSETVIDFGCGYGGLVAAMHGEGVTNIVGTDISQWSIEEGHRRYPRLKQKLQFYNRDVLRHKHDILIMLDVLEHMPDYEIQSVLKLAKKGKPRLFAVRIPVALKEGQPFVLPVSNNDPTHISCHTKEWWFETFLKSGFQLSSFLSSPTIYDSAGVLAAILCPCYAKSNHKT